MGVRKKEGSGKQARDEIGMGMLWGQGGEEGEEILGKRWEKFL